MPVSNEPAKPIASDPYGHRGRKAPLEHPPPKPPPGSGY